MWGTWWWHVSAIGPGKHKSYRLATYHPLDRPHTGFPCCCGFLSRRSVFMAYPAFYGPHCTFIVILTASGTDPSGFPCPGLPLSSRWKSSLCQMSAFCMPGKPCGWGQICCQWNTSQALLVMAAAATAHSLAGSTHRYISLGKPEWSGSLGFCSQTALLRRSTNILYLSAHDWCVVSSS